MFGRERFIIIFYSDEGLAVDDVGKRHVGSVATIAVGSDEHRLRVEFCMFQQCIKTYAFPLHIEVRPLGDTGNVHYIFLHG